MNKKQLEKKGKVTKFVLKVFVFKSSVMLHNEYGKHYSLS